jgi:hypothetical protein
MQLPNVDLRAVCAALPAVGVAWKALASLATARSLESRLRRHAELLKEIPDGVESSQLRRLVEEETQTIALRAEERLHRKFNLTNFAVVLVVTALATGLVLACWWLGGQADVTGLRLFVRGIAVIIAVAGAILIAVGSMDIWKDDREPPHTRRPMAARA